MDGSKAHLELENETLMQIKDDPSLRSKNKSIFAKLN